jgi:hypothetical protein
MCPRYGGHLYTTTVIGGQVTAKPVADPRPETAGEAVALRVTLGRIVRLVLR